MRLLNNFIRSFLLLALFVFCVFGNTVLAAKNKISFGYVEQIRLAMKLTGRADDELMKQMQFVARQLFYFKKENGHFPEKGTEEEYFWKKLKPSLSSNPYNNQIKVANLIDTRSFHLSIDGTLNHERIKEFISKPPNSWQNAPGSISAISNGESIFIIWGTGNDGYPIRDYSSNSIRLLEIDTQNY